jgi:uncharacterized protein YbjT (DUF2867 family)
MILVAGATGYLGSEICRRLRERGVQVRALVRATSAPEKIARLRDLGAEIVVGDLKDRPSLDAACRGADTVISTVTMITTAQPGDSFDATDNAGTRSLIDAAKKGGARHFIFVSFDATNFADAPLVRAKREAEEHLRASGLTYTIIHPNLFMESWLGPIVGLDVAAGKSQIIGRGDNRLSYVAAADVAELAAQCVSSPAARNATIPIGGPEAMSQREAIHIFEEVFEKPFDVTEIPAEALEAQWRSAADPFTKTFSALMLGATHDFEVDNRAVREHFPMRLTSVRDYVQRLAGRDASRREALD